MILRWLVIFLLLSSVESFAFKRLMISFKYKGEVLRATFFSNVSANSRPSDILEFNKVARFLEAERIRNYLARHGDADAELKNPSPEFLDWLTHCFEQEPLILHDEIMVLHRGPLGELGSDVPQGIGKEVLGLVAVDRLGDPLHDSYSEAKDTASEKLLLEKRLARVLSVERPKPYPWYFPGLPPGVFAHWDPQTAAEYFQPGNIMVGDVVQASALFAKEGTIPLMHSLANAYGPFSTGRLIPRGVWRQINGEWYQGPKVFVPTLFVWELFNTFKDGKYKKGSRTVYYESSGATPLAAGGINEWQDPLLAKGNLVQVFHKTGNQFREGWTALFAEKEGFSLVNDVEILEAHHQYISGGILYQNAVADLENFAWHGAHQKSLKRCAQSMLDARYKPTPLLEIKVSFGTPVLVR